jgi:hypothetical protein
MLSLSILTLTHGPSTKSLLNLLSLSLPPLENLLNLCPAATRVALTPAPFTDPSEPIPDDLKELDDEDDWNEPEGRLDEAEMYDEDEDEE